MEFLKRMMMVILWGTLFAIILFGFSHWQEVEKLEKDILADMPPITDPSNIYAETNSNNIAKSIKNDLYRVYVPNSFNNTVSVIDPKTYKVIGNFVTGKNPQHVVPSYDLSTLWVLNDLDNSITPIDPKTSKPGKKVPVFDPYNMYYTPDGRFAIIIAEEGKRIDFRDAHTMKLMDTVKIPHKGLNHMDFTADGLTAVISCEFSGQLVRLDVRTHKVLGYLSLDSCTKKHCMPQDVRLSPDGRTFYIADMMMDGVFLVDAKNFKLLGYIKTGTGTHSIYPSRDGRLFYIGNRGCHSVNKCKPHGPGNIAVIDPNKQKLIATWSIPGGGSPDMGNVSPDGKELWLAGRYDKEVYVFDTTTGKLTHRIPVGGGPHGLAIWPQPGRYSLGHTGNMR